MNSPMTTTTRQVGMAGEELASQLLAAAGYAIVERNAEVGRVEVDIIASHHNRIVFVEVKTRRAGTLDPRYGITPDKISRLARAAATYVRSRNLPHEVQIDVILITNHADGSVEAEHIPDITLPPLRRRR
ncbi:MAG: YraN family protein [Muribaculaceae bacterium]|nr:YraN family protein [Muribaculaceae bacterium]